MITCETWCVREPQHSGKCWDWRAQRADDGMAGALQGLEQVMQRGPVFGTALFCVARDMCLERGVVLSATSNRRVNVRKSNRPRRDGVDGTIRRMNNWFRNVYGPALESILPRTPPALSQWYGERFIRYQWDSDKLFVEAPTAVGMDALSPANGFTYAGAHGVIDLLESPYLREGEAVLINGQVFTAPVIDEHSAHVSGHAMALAAAINARPAAGVSARAVDGRILLASTPAARLSMVEHMLEQSMLYGTSAVRVVMDDPLAPADLVPPVVLAHQRVRSDRLDALMRSAGHRAGESRVPPFIPQRRLDGRRAR